jgi:hypothetical protein
MEKTLSNNSSRTYNPSKKCAEASGSTGMQYTNLKRITPSIGIIRILHFTCEMEIDDHHYQKQNLFSFTSLGVFKAPTI